MSHCIEESILISKRVTKQRFRYSIFQAWQQLCAYCSAHADTLDHVVPRVKGGMTVRENLIPACQRCNGKKGHSDWLVFLSASEWHNVEREARIREWIQAPQPPQPQGHPESA